MARVRTHTRRTADGRTTTVHQHTRRGQPRRPVLSLRHAWQLAKRSYRAGRRKRRFIALVLGAAAVGEVTLFLTARSTGLLLGTAGILAVSAAVLLGGLTGLESTGAASGRRRK